jgi:hypothetical protein
MCLQGTVESIINYSNKIFISGKFKDVTQDNPMFPIHNFDKNFIIESEKLKYTDTSFKFTNISKITPIVQQKNLVNIPYVISFLEEQNSIYVNFFNRKLL